MGEGRTEEEKKKKGINCTISSRVLLLLLLLNYCGDQISRKIYPLRFPLPLQQILVFRVGTKDKRFSGRFLGSALVFPLLLLFQSVFDKPWDIFMRSPSTPLFYHLGVFLVVGGVTDIPPFLFSSSGKNQVYGDS